MTDENVAQGERKPMASRPLRYYRRGMYLKLFHGSKMHQELDDWGDEGPTFGPLAWVHTTYGEDIKLLTVEQGDAGGDACGTLTIHDGLVYYDGMFYGDWSVYAGHVYVGDAGHKSPLGLVPLEAFDPEKALTGVRKFERAFPGVLTKHDYRLFDCYEVDAMVGLNDKGKVVDRDDLDAPLNVTHFERLDADLHPGKRPYCWGLYGHYGEELSERRGVDHIMDFDTRGDAMRAKIMLERDLSKKGYERGLLGEEHR